MMKTKNSPFSSEALSRGAAMAQTGIITAIVLVFSLAVILFNYHRLDSQLDSRISSIAAFAETTLASSVWQVDHASARDFTDAVIKDPAVIFAQVVTGREVMASRSKRGYLGRPFEFFKTKGNSERK